MAWNDSTTPQKRSDLRPRWKKKRYWIPAAGLTAVFGLAAIGAATEPPAGKYRNVVAVDETTSAAGTTAPTTPAATTTVAPVPTVASTTPPPVVAPTTRAPAPTVRKTIPRPAPTTERPRPAPTTKAPPPKTTDPRFGTCKAAKAAGYGPYYEGQDVEYDWYRDADHDGVVCE